jgi:hypothetical protein
MARRTLSMQGRILAAGVSVAVGAALIGVMAASDRSAGASSSSPPAATPSVSPSSGGATSATPYDGDGTSQPQPQTRTGGS